MGRVYATADDYAAWSGAAAPSDVDRRLARASELVELATVTAYYDVDAAGMPTDADVLAAFRDATCAQVAWWQATGDELGDAGLWQAASIGSVSLSGRRQTGSAAGDRLAPQARTVLALAGLVHRPATT